jgi:hypothetical protein
MDVSGLILIAEASDELLEAASGRAERTRIVVALEPMMQRFHGADHVN